MNLAKCVLVAGPTASGKSEVALAVAERIGGEIVSVDSMQVYRGMDIGTAKPSAEERRRVRHHLLDVCDLTETFDAARFAAMATESIRDIQSRGKVPILCGGTGFYIKSLLYRLPEAPPANALLRRELESTPIPALLAELSAADPEAFQVIDKANLRRVIRAIEVIRLTGRPFSSFRPGPEPPSAEPANPLHIVLSREPEDLRQRIERRVDVMFERGLVEEVRGLLRDGLGENIVAAQALGYRQIIDHLRGERPLDETVAGVKTRTKQFARRQVTWFKNQLSLRWMHLRKDATPESVAEHLASAAQRVV